MQAYMRNYLISNNPDQEPNTQSTINNWQGPITTHDFQSHIRAGYMRLHFSLSRTSRFCYRKGAKKAFRPKPERFIFIRKYFPL